MSTDERSSEASHDISYASSNRQHFDQSASLNQTESPQALELARRTACAIRKVYQFDEDSTTVLDFACGAGLISQELAPYAKSIVGVDISQGMVDKYNQRVADQGIPEEEMHAVCAELKGMDGELSSRKFSVVVCALSYHHFPDIVSMTRTLAFFLEPNGVLVVVDLVKADHLDLEALFPDHSKLIVAHKGGFKEEEIKDAYERTGLEDFSFADAVNVKKKGHDLKLFVAVGRKK